MASNLKLSTAAQNATVDALCALLNGGSIRIYAGSQPATADTAIGSQVLLGTCTFANPAFGSASSGMATANAITGTTDAAATGEAAFFRALTSGAAAVLDGSCGTANADCLLSSTSIVIHGSITVSAMTVRG